MLSILTYCICVQYQLHGIIFNCSMLDVILWIFLLFCFFAVPKGAWPMWFLAGHPVRGFLGMLVLQRVPSMYVFVTSALQYVPGMLVSQYVLRMLVSQYVLVLRVSPAYTFCSTSLAFSRCCMSSA